MAALHILPLHMDRDDCKSSSFVMCAVIDILYTVNTRKCVCLSCLPAVSRGLQCLQRRSYLRLQPVKIQPSAMSTDMEHHYFQGPQFGGQNTPPCAQGSCLDIKEEKEDWH